MVIRIQNNRILKLELLYCHFNSGELWKDLDVSFSLMLFIYSNMMKTLTFLLSSFVSGRRTTFPRTRGFVRNTVEVELGVSSLRWSFESSWRSLRATLLTTPFAVRDSVEEMCKTLAAGCHFTDYGNLSAIDVVFISSKLSEVQPSL